jgi:hypothetical protein
MSAWSRIAELDPAYRRYRAWVKATGPTCAICGHPGALSVDHWRAPARYPTIAVQLALDPANWRPAHGIEGCYQCPPNPSRDKRRRGNPTRCNQSKGAKADVRISPRRW